MKTLIVKYLPRGERSHTKKVLDAYLEEIQDTVVEELDLCGDVPDMFLPDNLHAYVKRNYLGETLSEKEAKLMGKMDRMTQQFISADIVVIAFPMHNFSLPAMMKAYFDSIMQKGETWDANTEGYFGLMKGKKALAIMASGGIYEDKMASWDHGLPLTLQEFQLMGFEDIRTVSVSGMNMVPEPDKIVADKQKEVKSITREWYK